MTSSTRETSTKNNQKRDFYHMTEKDKDSKKIMEELKKNKRRNKGN